MTLMLGYIVLLCALVLGHRERGSMRRTVWTLFATMLAGYAYHYSVGSDWTYSAFMILVNALACRVITMRPAAEWQALIGWSFILQIGADTGRVAREINVGPGDITFLYWVTTVIAFAQLLLVIGWGVHARLGSPAWWNRRHPVAAPARPEGWA